MNINFKCFLKYKNSFLQLGRSSFQPKTGKLLAYPNNKEIVLLETVNWQQKFTLNHPQVFGENSNE